MRIYSVLSEMEICTKWDDKEYPEEDNNKGEKEAGDGGDYMEKLYNMSLINLMDGYETGIDP